MTGAAGHVCQGKDWKTAKPVAFWSGKFSSAEQAYPTHEQELLAIVESLKRFRHHLLGTKFTIVTDHEKLDKFMTQKDLSRRQIRWLETLCDFDFEIKYSPGKLNILADALSRIYSHDDSGTERASSEYVTSDQSPDEEDEAKMGLFCVEPTVWPSRPILVGKEVEIELLTMNVMYPEPRRNPVRGKARRVSMRVESESEDSPWEVIERKRGRGRRTKSVLEATTEPAVDLTMGESSVAPGSSGESEMEPPTTRRAAHTKRWFDSDDEGESEIEEPIAAKVSAKEKDAPEQKKTTHAKKWVDPEDIGESEMEETPQNQVSQSKSVAAKLAEDHSTKAQKGNSTEGAPVRRKDPDEINSTTAQEA
jgi:hypothetical protein